MTSARSIPSDCRPTREELLLLRSALLQGDPARLAWEEWRGRARRPLPTGSQRLLPSVYRNLRESVPPDPWLEVAKTEYLRARYTNLLRFDDAMPVLEGLRESGLSFLLLKGAALVAAYYGDPGLRPMVDLDVMVREEEVERAIVILRGHGYNPLATVEPAARAMVHSAPFERAGAPPLDLHWRAFELEEDRSIWDRVEEVSLHGVPLRVPGPADQLLHACVQGSCWDWDAQQRWVLDAMAVLRSSGERLEWRVLVARAISERLSPGVQDSLRFLREEFGVAIPEEVRRALVVAPASRWEHHAARGRRVRPDLRGPLMVFGLRLDEHRRRVRRGAAEAGMGGFLQVWRQSWGLSGLWMLPVHAVTRGARRALQLARQVLGP